MVTAVVFSGGPVEGRHPAEDVLSTLDAELAVAVDSGLELAQHLGWHVDLVVGDMDSVAPGALDRAESDGATVRRHPVAKDATDLELALEEAAAAGAGRVVVVGSPAGRMDHLLGAAEIAELHLLVIDRTVAPPGGVPTGTRQAPPHDSRSLTRCRTLGTMEP